MPETVRVAELPGRVGSTVTVRAWTMTTRSSGKIAFVTLRDGTGYLQAVLSKKDVPDAAWDAFGRLTQLRGGDRRRARRCPGAGRRRASDE
ncbi:MAG: hypothetical protein DMD49_11220 [Gemmatimonadetes bacterium]|nr:MAG: hypothetical protein DMD49_11220 [Gemmatimonadota bacterium]